MLSQFLTPAVITAIAILSAAAGIALTSLHGVSRPLVPFGGGVLVGVGLFWVLPEMAGELHWMAAVAWIGAGIAALWAVDRFVYPVCSTCSVPDEHEHAHDGHADHDHAHHDHAHHHDAPDVPGFAAPLLVAASVHAALDGWSVLAAQGVTHLSRAFVLAIAIHKIPEGIALGVIVRAAVGSRRSALGWCALAEAATLAGAALETFLAPYVGANTLQILLAAAGGSFLYLGFHAVQGEWQRRGATPAWVPGLAGLASPALLRLWGVFR